MTMTKTLALLLVLALAVVGCNTKTDGTKDDKKADGKKAGNKKSESEDDHVHGQGPHKGLVFDFGKYHAELVVDHDKKECTIYILGADQKTSTPVAADELTITTKETKTKKGDKVEAMTITLKAQETKDGKSARFVGTDPGLGNVADFEGTLMGKVDGKPVKDKFKE